MMKIPNQLNIAGNIYHLKTSKNAKEIDGFWGQIKYSNRVITIPLKNKDNENLIEDVQIDSIFHEIFHIITTEYLEEELKEKDINRLAKIFIGILRMNKDLLKLL